MMDTENISSQFFKAMYNLAGLSYDISSFNQHSLEARTIVNQFVYDPLTAEQKQQIESRSKTHRMKIPPALDSMIDMPFVSDQVNAILDLVKSGKTFDEINDLYATGEPISVDEFNQLLATLLNKK